MESRNVLSVLPAARPTWSNVGRAFPKGEAMPLRPQLVTLAIAYTVGLLGCGGRAPRDPPTADPCGAKPDDSNCDDGDACTWWDTCQAGVCTARTNVCPNPIERVSVASNAAQADNNSFSSSISADGRFVAFASLATNLVPGDTNDSEDVFVRDRATGQTTRVSVASNGAQADDWSFPTPSISADGRFVAFTSFATNLVPGDTNGIDDVFVHDRATGETTRVSVASNAAQAEDRSWDAALWGGPRG